MTASKITKHANILTSYPLTAWDILKHKWDIAGPAYQVGVPITQIIAHDYTKFSPSIFPAYAEFFHGEERTPEVWADFKEAYHKHWSKEPHHWHQRPDVWGKVEDKPLAYRLETLADTYGAAKRVSKDQNFPNFKLWYTMNKNKFAPSDLQEIVNEKLAMSKSNIVMLKHAMNFGSTRKILQELESKGVKLTRTSAPSVAGEDHGSAKNLLVANVKELFGKRTPKINTINIQKNGIGEEGMSPRAKLFHEYGHFKDDEILTPVSNLRKSFQGAKDTVPSRIDILKSGYKALTGTKRDQVVARQAITKPIDSFLGEFRTNMIGNEVRANTNAKAAMPETYHTQYDKETAIGLNSYDKALPRNLKELSNKNKIKPVEQNLTIAKAPERPNAPTMAEFLSRPDVPRKKKNAFI